MLIIIIAHLSFRGLKDHNALPCPLSEHCLSSEEDRARCGRGERGGGAGRIWLDVRGSVLGVTARRTQVLA